MPTTSTPIAPLPYAVPVLLLLLWANLACFNIERPGVCVHGFAIRPQEATRPSNPSLLLLLRLAATDVITNDCKNELLSLVRNTPSGVPTPKDVTQQILRHVRQLEGQCPTPEDQIAERLNGSWELLWTAQDPQSRETNQLFSSWINPLENQSYSNNPQGRANPMLPMELQNRLEQAGLVSSTPIRSTQSIDSASGLIRNVVAVDLSLGNKNSRRRASLTVTVRFTLVPSDPRRLNVKFDACRVSLPPILQWNFPLGVLGPTGWLRTVYMDEELRITRGHKGSVFVLARPRL